MPKERLSTPFLQKVNKSIVKIKNSVHTSSSFEFSKSTNTGNASLTCVRGGHGLKRQKFANVQTASLKLLIPNGVAGSQIGIIWFFPTFFFCVCLDRK